MLRTDALRRRLTWTMAALRSLMDFIVDNSAPGLESHVIADLFDRMIWVFADNGGALLAVVREWLDQGDDLRRVKIGLAMQEAFVYARRTDIEEAFARLARRYPEVGDA